MKPLKLKSLLGLLIAALCLAPLANLPIRAQDQTLFEEVACFEEVARIEGARCGYVSCSEVPC